MVFLIGLCTGNGRACTYPRHMCGLLRSVTRVVFKRFKIRKYTSFGNLDAIKQWQGWLIARVSDS